MQISFKHQDMLDQVLHTFVDITLGAGCAQALLVTGRYPLSTSAQVNAVVRTVVAAAVAIMPQHFLIHSPTAHGTHVKLGATRISTVGLKRI
eukprot:s653_g6.t1